MSKFICGIVTATSAIIGMIGIVGAITIPAAGSPSCMSKDEASKAFPGAHIYWHGPQHCWDNSRERRRQTPVTANTGDHPAKPADIDKPSEAAVTQASEPAAGSPGEPVTIPPVRFIGDDLTRALSWPALSTPAYAQADDPLPAAAPYENEDVVIGAATAARGSPDDLLENCCWPPSLPGEAAGHESLRRMLIASTGACALATGLWLFVYRRRQFGRFAVAVKREGRGRWDEPSTRRV